MGLDRSFDQLHALGDGTHLLFQESVDLVEKPPRTTPNKTYEDATHRLEVNALVAIENEDLPTAQNLAVDRAKRHDHTSVHPRVFSSNSLTISVPVWDRTFQRSQASCTASVSQFHFLEWLS